MGPWRGALGAVHSLCMHADPCWLSTAVSGWGINGDHCGTRAFASRLFAQLLKAAVCPQFSPEWGSDALPYVLKARVALCRCIALAHLQAITASAVE